MKIIPKFRVIKEACSSQIDVHDASVYYKLKAPVLLLQPHKRTQKRKTESSDSSSVSIEEEEEEDDESGDTEEVEDPDETDGMLKYIVYNKNFLCRYIIFVFQVPVLVHNFWQFS